MKKKWLFTLLIVIIAIAMGYIFYDVEFIEGFLQDTKTMSTSMYDTLEEFFDTELEVIGNNLKEFNSLYLIRISSYLLVCTGVLAILASILRSSFNSKFFKVLNIIVGSLIFILAGFGLYGTIKVGTSRNEGVVNYSVTIWGYIYYVLALMTSLILIGSSKQE